MIKDSYAETKVYVSKKSGRLYAIIKMKQIENGEKVEKRFSKALKLDDTPKNMKIAKKIVDELCFQYNNGHSPIDENILMSDYVKRILETNRREWADTTYSSYYHRGKYIIQFFEEVHVKDITIKDINDFYDYLLNDGRMKNNASSKKKGLSLRTVRDIKAFMNMIFIEAEKEGIITKNPAEQATLSKKLVRDNEYVKEDELFFDCDECKRFLEISKKHELYELFYFTMYFGLRRSEVLGLKWSSIDLENSSLSILSTVTKGTEINRENSVKSKSSKRTYPLSPRQCEILNHIKNRQNQNKMLFGDCYVDSDYVFTHEDGSLYYPDYPTKAFKKLLKKDTTLPQNIHFHGLRASCVSLLVQQGFSLKEIQEWVGHADITTTQKYYMKIKSAEAKKNVSRRMDSLIAI